MTAQPSHDLVHASHIRLAYRAMLGREASADEIRVQLAGLRTTSELLTILAESAEFTGTSKVLLDPKSGPTRVNTWVPELSAWTHQPGTVSPDEVAVVGNDGWLFIQGGSNSNVGQHTGAVQMASSWASQWSELLAFRQREAERLGITAAYVVVPDKLAVQEEFFPAALDVSGLRPVERLIQELNLPITYPLEALRAARADGEVYLRTDSHYSLRGNFIVHEAVSKALGIAPLSPSVIADAQSYLASGDLGRRFDPQVVEVMRSTLSFGAAQVTEDNRDVVAATGGHIGSRRVFSTPSAPDPRTAVLFGDSYGFANPGYEGLVWWLAQQFREVHFVWTPFGWDADYAQSVGATVVVSQTAERFVGRVPAQAVDVAELTARAVGSAGAINPDIVFDARG